MMPARMIFDIRVAQKIADDELLVAKSLGFDWHDAVQSGLDALDDMLNISRKPERLAVVGRFRPCQKH